MNFLENVILIIVVAFMAVWIGNIKKNETVKIIKVNGVSENAKAEMLAGERVQLLYVAEKLAKKLEDKDPSFSPFSNVKCDEVRQVCRITMINIPEKMLLDNDFFKSSIGGEKYNYQIQLRKSEPTSGTIIIF